MCQPAFKFDRVDGPQLPRHHSATAAEGAARFERSRPRWRLPRFDGAGCEQIRRKLRRRDLVRFFEKLSPCLVGMEACAGAHHWARQIAGYGHEVRLIPPAYVPYPQAVFCGKHRAYWPPYDGIHERALRLRYFAYVRTLCSRNPTLNEKLTANSFV
jgi:hypothetical protein